MQNREHWHKVAKLFHAALELEPAQRAAFLANACGSDGQMLSEVQSLIAVHEKGGSFIDSPVHKLEESATIDSPPSIVGQSIAHYMIVALLGKGGRGEVYLARDQKLGRNVAIKVLPSDLSQDPER